MQDHNRTMNLALDGQSLQVWQHQRDGKRLADLLSEMSRYFQCSVRIADSFDAGSLDDTDVVLILTRIAVKIEFRKRFVVENRHRTIGFKQQTHVLAVEGDFKIQQFAVTVIPPGLQTRKVEIGGKHIIVGYVFLIVHFDRIIEMKKVVVNLQIVRGRNWWIIKDSKTLERVGVFVKLNNKTKRWNKAGKFKFDSPFSFV